MKSVLYGLAGVLIVAGLLVAIASFLSPGQVIHGIDAGLAGTLIAGGAIVLALAWLNESVVALEQTLSRALRLLDTRMPLVSGAAVAAPSQGLREERSDHAPPAGEDTLAATAAAAAAVREAVSDEAETPAGPSPRAEPVTQAAAEAEGAESLPAQTLDIVEEVVVVETAEPADTTQAAEDAASEEELYVVEEREFRGKPARVLSDGTVEAETDEGWMRIENMEHLEEYMDAMAAMAAGRA